MDPAAWRGRLVLSDVPCAQHHPGPWAAQNKWPRRAVAWGGTYRQRPTSLGTGDRARGGQEGTRGAGTPPTAPGPFLGGPPGDQLLLGLLGAQPWPSDPLGTPAQ